MEKPINIEITEIFTAKADDNCFQGTIKRCTDANGNPFVFGKIRVRDQIIVASAKDQWELSKKLDELALYALNRRF